LHPVDGLAITSKLWRCNCCAFCCCWWWCRFW